MAGLDWEQLKGDKVKALTCYLRAVMKLREALSVQFGTEAEPEMPPLGNPPIPPHMWSRIRGGSRGNLLGWSLVVGGTRALL